MRIGRLGLDLDLWLKGWIALQRVAWAIILLGGHAAFKFALARLFEDEMLPLQKMLSILFGVAIVSLDTSLLIEAVRIFLPEPYGIKLEIDGRTHGNGDEPASNT